MEEMMKHRPRPSTLSLGLVAALAVVWLAGGCALPEFDRATYITKLRVLAIRAEPPEAAPGEEVAITGLAADGHGAVYDGYWLWVVLGANLMDLATQNLDEMDIGSLPAGAFGIQEPGGEPFIFRVPAAAEFAEAYGPYNPAGTLLTVALMIFEDAESLEDVMEGRGQLRFAYKTLIVSERPQEQRNTNPVFVRIDVEYLGQVPEQDEDGFYLIPDRTESVRLTAHFDNIPGDRITYSWFAASEDGFEAQGGKVQFWRTAGSHQEEYVFVVCRNNYLFEAADDYAIRSTGIDFGYVRFRFPY